MSETPGSDLQFESAEFEGAAKKAACAACGAAIHDAYYEVDGKVTCESCRYKAEAARAGGSGPGRFVKAAVFGGVAAALGAGLYYGVSALTGYEFGLIAIVVGLMVGTAVRAGSAGRGGVPYQLLAVFLTYTSIVSTYIPPIIQEIGKKDSATAPAAETPATMAAAPSAPAKASAAAPAPAAAVPAAVVAPSFAAFALAVLMLLGILFAAPFLMGFENVIGIVIIGIGLYEAWKINRKAPLVIGGPFRIGATAAPETAPPPITP